LLPLKIPYPLLQLSYLVNDAHVIILIIIHLAFGVFALLMVVCLTNDFIGLLIKTPRISAQNHRDKTPWISAQNHRDKITSDLQV
jgi:hypothetical protein